MIWAVRAIRLLLLVALLGLNLRAYAPGDLESGISQLRFLRDALAEGAAERMQQRLPEGFVFTWSLYGLAWSQVALSRTVSGDVREEALEGARTAIAQVGSAAARATFIREMDPPYGAFYASWFLYLRANYLRALDTSEPDAAFLAGFERDCDRFAQALARNRSPFLPSYPGRSWPVDTLAGVAALGIRDAELPPRHADTLASWVRRSRSRLDPETRLLTFATPDGEVRGSALALASRLLVDVDRGFAREQYEGLRNHFVDDSWGWPGFREYPRGREGEADVDSGPLVLGFSGPASVVGAGAARVHGDEALARSIFGLGEIVGVPFEWRGRRRYWAGLVPVGDAFLAWSVTASAAPEIARASHWEPILPSAWALPLHLGSALIAAISIAHWIRVEGSE
jgi:hypothetical protein